MESNEFTLNIIFTGMCLYVRDGSEMHVLMPGIPGAGGTPHPHAPAGGEAPQHDHARDEQEGTHAGGSAAAAGKHVEPHASVLMFDTAHLRPGSTGHDHLCAIMSFRELMLDLPALGSAFSDRLPTDLISVNRQIRPDVLGPAKADTFLTSRVTLRSGQWTAHDSGACWDWEAGPPRPFSHVIQWTIERFPGDRFEHPLMSLGGGAGGSVGPLYPVGNVITLEVLHVPPAELPPVDIIPGKPAVGQEAHHFTAYDRLLTKPVGRLPKFNALRCESAAQVGNRGRVAYTCMSATL